MRSRRTSRCLLGRAEDETDYGLPENAEDGTSHCLREHAEDGTSNCLLGHAKDGTVEQLANLYGVGVVTDVGLALQGSSTWGTCGMLF